MRRVKPEAEHIINVLSQENNMDREDKIMFVSNKIRQDRLALVEEVRVAFNKWYKDYPKFHESFMKELDALLGES